MAYQPFTPRGEEMLALGFPENDIRDFEAVHDARGQAELVHLHPDAANPEVMQRVGLEIAQNAEKYRRRLEHEGAGSVYLDAYARAMAQPGPAPDPGTASGRVREGHDPLRRGAPSLVEQPDVLAEAQRLWRATGELSPANARKLGYGNAFSHPDMRDEPGLSR